MLGGGCVNEYMRCEIPGVSSSVVDNQSMLIIAYTSW